MDVELAEVRDFLAGHEPFSKLPRGVLDELPKRLNAKYYRRGTVIVAAGDTNDYMYILRSGGVDIIDAHGGLVDREDPGGTFGMSSVMSGSPSLYTLRAHEDSLCLLMHADLFHHLLTTDASFSQFFVAQQAARMRNAVQGSHSDSSGSAILRTRVRDIIKKQPITIEPTATIREAAQLMTEKRVSALLVTVADRLVGIVTDRDLRTQVVAQDRPSGEPVSNIMTANPSTTSPESLAFEVLVDMTQRGFHHLPVVEGGSLVGMVTSGDLMRLEQANPTFLVGHIATQTTMAGLVAATRRVPQVVETCVSQDATNDDIARVVTAIADATTRKIIEFAQADLGAPPVPYCWVALGSQGRQETGMQSDQDNAIIIDDTVTPEQLPWFADLAERVVAGLEECGYERCPGDMMATNPHWRQPLRTWGTYFARWINEPEPDALLNAQTFFDMRPIAGDATLATRLQQAIVTLTPRSPRFQAYLAKGAQQFQPPIGFFRDFVLEGEGEHKNTLDLKAGGIATIVQMARLFALSKGITELNTITRLKAAAAAEALSEENANNLIDAFEFINDVRVRHQVRQLKVGSRPDNHVPPSSLTQFEKRSLRDAFQIVRKMQGALAYIHRTDLTS